MKSISGSAEICNFRFFGVFEQFLAKTISGSSPKFREPEVGDFGATRCGFSQKSPNLDYLTGFFGVFEQFLAKPHLVARQNVTFSTLGWCMSGMAIVTLMQCGLFLGQCE